MLRLWIPALITAIALLCRVGIGGNQRASSDHISLYAPAERPVFRTAEEEAAMAAILATGSRGGAATESGRTRLEHLAERGSSLAQYLLGWQAFRVDKDPETAVNWLRLAGDGGVPEAQALLGRMHMYGWGAPQDGVEAERWLRRAADLGDLDGQFHLGALLIGEGKDPARIAEGVKWIRRSAEAGHEDAQFELAGMYLEGVGVDVDHAEAVKWCRLAAEQGQVDAQYGLGLMYLAGFVVQQDDAAAAKWLEKPAVWDIKDARARLVELWDAGRGLPEDVFKAIVALKARAEEGLVEAQLALGIAYAEGRPGIVQDDDRARAWLRAAAEQGNPDAQFRLSERLPLFGREADDWCRRAAEQGHADAQLRMYLSSKHNGRSHSEAVKWLLRAAEQGVSFAQKQASLEYAAGLGVPVNHVLAYAWANVAAANGEPEAASLRDELADRMTPDQVAEGQRISAAFRPRRESAGASTHTRQPETAVVALTGSGFLLTPDGFFVTCHHVVDGASRIRVRIAERLFAATVVRSDATSDLALLKIDGEGHEFVALPIARSGGLRPGDRVATLGYPNPSLQGQAPKYTSGEVASLSGPADDPRLLQISVPVQPGSSGGPLVDGRGRVVGVIVGGLDKLIALRTTGSVPENVNYAVKGSLLLALIETVPGLLERVPEQASGSPRDPADVAKSLEVASGIVMVERAAP